MSSWTISGLWIATGQSCILILFAYLDSQTFLVARRRPNSRLTYLDDTRNRITQFINKKECVHIHLPGKTKKVLTDSPYCPFEGLPISPRLGPPGRALEGLASPSWPSGPDRAGPGPQKTYIYDAVNQFFGLKLLEIRYITP